MTYEEFEWNILRLAYEDGLERFQASFVAYALGLPVETVSSYLEHATHNGLIEMDVTDDGRLEYFVPGAEHNSPLPKPVWKEEFEGGADEQRPDANLDESAPRQAGPPADGSVGSTLPAERAPAEAQPSAEPTDGRVGAEANTSRALAVRAPHRSNLPAALRAHIEERYGSEDGSVTAFARSGAVAVVERGATVHDADEVVIEGQLVKADEDDNLPLRIETGLDTFTDPSQTIFMRQLKIYGVESEDALREHVERLFTSFGYDAVSVGGQRMRFERGSVTFILALVPLFVLVLPLFVYLFLYCMGRSTIQQEPIELDVQLRKLADEQGTYEIDLTFIGMHGVVLGAADQRVLNQEVDTLRDELQWALSS
jgi:hypothetical protein